MTEIMTTREKSARVTALILAFIAINLALAILSTTSTPSNSLEADEPDVLSQSVGNLQVAEPHADLSKSNLKHLQLLGAYEERFGFGLGEMMIIVKMPESLEQAEVQAKAAASILKEFAKYDINPFIIFEPRQLDLRNIDQEVLAEYFSELEASGINDNSIGTWAFFPQPNIPEWGTGETRGHTDPETFKENYKTVAQQLKDRFPRANTAVLLSSASYESGDIERQNGPDYTQETLRQYVDGLPKELVDEAAMLGFPSAPRSFNPEAGYMNSGLAIMIGNKLKVDKIHLITGTFSRMSEATLSHQARKIILDDILLQAKKVQSEGFEVQLDIVTEDRYDKPENADWSYAEGDEWDLFEKFIGQAHKSDMRVTVFDKPDQL